MARKRRRRGEGSIYKRADGYWVGQVEAGRGIDGKRRKARVVRARRADVVAALDELRRQVRLGVVPDNTRTVATYLEWWLSDVIAGTVTAGTLHEYNTRVKRITPVIGHVKLGKLTTAHVQHLANHLAKTYPRSAKTRAHTLATLRQALRWAVGADLIVRNPAEPRSARLARRRPMWSVHPSPARIRESLHQQDGTVSASSSRKSLATRLLTPWAHIHPWQAAGS